MNKRIMICGASGTGKTTLAKHISEYYDIPYITTSAKQLWGKFGFKDHQDAYIKSINNPELGLDYQAHVLETRLESLENLDNFVTDRSYIDNITYIIQSLSFHVDDTKIQNLWDLCKESIEQIDGLIFLRFNEDVYLENDGYRINNRFYQMATDSIMANIINEYSLHDIFKQKPKVLNINTFILSIRTKIIHRWLTIL